MNHIDRPKILSWLSRAQRRVNDLTMQLQKAVAAVKLAKSPSHEEKLKVSLREVEADLRKAKGNLTARRAELEAFDAKAGTVNP